jgi:hypothetical protein
MAGQAYSELAPGSAHLPPHDYSFDLNHSSLALLELQRLTAMTWAVDAKMGAAFENPSPTSVTEMVEPTQGN